MKRLKLQVSFSNLTKKHSIYISRGNYLEHRSKTFLNKYLRTYKQVLIDNIKILNSLYKQSSSVYRSFYFDFDFRTVNRLAKLNQTFVEEFDMILYNPYQTENVNVFFKISTSFEALFEMAQTMYDHSKTHKNYALKNQVYPLIKQLHNLYENYHSDRKSLDLSKTVKTQIKQLQKCV